MRLVWVVVNAFLRLTTKPGLFEHPLSITEAWEIVEAWLQHANLCVVHETEEHARLRSDLPCDVGTGRDATTDACITAIARAHGASVLTLDSKFARFPDVRSERPLAR